jgi:hypothetical protein
MQRHGAARAILLPSSGGAQNKGHLLGFTGSPQSSHQGAIKISDRSEWPPAPGPQPAIQAMTNKRARPKIPQLQAEVGAPRQAMHFRRRAGRRSLWVRTACSLDYTWHTDR